MAQGRCLCGALAYELDGPFSAMIHCHCSICRKHHGTGFATFVVGPVAGFRWTSGEDKLVRYRSSHSAVRAFCSVCGSAGPWPMPERGIAAAPSAGFDGDLGIKPRATSLSAPRRPGTTLPTA